MRILFIDTVHYILKKNLEKKLFRCDTAYEKNKSEIELIIHKYDGLIIRSRFSIDKKFIDKAKNLKFIARAGSGLENINLSHAKRKKIKCFNAPEGNRKAVAEHSLGMLLCLLNNINISDTQVRQGKWNREANRGLEIGGKTIGIIGFGNNGSALAELLLGFGTKIIAYDKYLKKYPFKSNMQELFKQSDIVSINVPLTEETKYLVNKDFIRNFKKPFYLINTARGKCVNTDDLVSELISGKVLGACLDVLEYENSSFEKLKNNFVNEEIKYLVKSKQVIITPHIAGWSEQSNYKIAKILTKKIISNFC